MQKYQDSVLNSVGSTSPAVGALVYVLIHGTQTSASLFSDSAGTQPISNPLTTDNGGFFSFYAANGHYDLQVVFNGQVISRPDVILLDPSNAQSYVQAGGSMDGTTTGFQQPYSGSKGRTWEDKGQDIVNVLDFSGVVGNGSNDDTAGLQVAINSAASNGRILMSRGLTLKITSSITIPPTLRADFSGSVINASALTSGSALIMDGSDSIAAGNYPGYFRSLTLLMPLTSGHANTALSVDGLSIQGGAGQASDYGWYDLQIYGFRDNLRFDGPNCYLHNFYHAKIGNAWRRGVAVYASSNSNENYAFFGGSIFNVNNTSFNGTGFYIDPAASTCDASFIGTSFDYCDASMNVTNCHINCDGVHFENNNNNPHIAVSFTSGGEKPVVILKGGQMGGGPGVTSWTGIPVESASGRPYLITTTAGGANIEVDFVKCGQFITSAPYQTEIIHSTDGIANRKLTVRPALDAVATSGGALPLNLTFLVNNLYVAGAGSSTGWNTSLLGSGNTVSADTVNFVSPDTGSRKITCASGNSGGIYQVIPCRGGETLCLKSFVQCSGLSAGGGTHRLQFYAPDGTTIFSDIILARQQTANGAFAEVSWYGQVPNGATQVRIWDWVLSGTTAGATVEWSREFAWFYS